MNLIAFVGKDTDNWGQISALVNRMECERVVIVQASDAPIFPASEKCEVVTSDSSLPIVALKNSLMSGLKPLLGSEFEVAISLASGTGKEHMALLGALLAIPVGVRVVVYTKEGVQFLT